MLQQGTPTFPKAMALCHRSNLLTRQLVKPERLAFFKEVGPRITLFL